MSRSRAAKALGISVALTALVMLSDLVLVSWHKEGIAQPLLAPANGIARVLGEPGYLASYVLNLRDSAGATVPGQLVTAGVCLGFYWVVAVVGLWLWNLGLARHRTGEISHDESGGPSRRAVLRGGVRLAAGGAAGVVGYSFAVEPNLWELTHRLFPVRDLPTSLAGLRILQVTDIHHGPWTTLDYVRDIVERANAVGADLVALTGDYIAGTSKYCEPVAMELAKLRGRIGVLAVLGNHDWKDVRVSKAAFAKAGVTLIDNNRRFITPDRRLVNASRDGLCIAGIGDLWYDVCDCEAAVGGLPGGIPVILMSHNPDAVEEPRLVEGVRKRRYRVDLMLSGHTHGGQIRLPLIGTPVTNSKFGSKYASGLVQGPAFPVYTCRGLGTTGLPLRLGVRPEMAVIELIPA